MTTVPLREMAARHGLRIGACANAQALKSDVRYAALLASEFSSLTTENALKFAALCPKRGRYDFTDADSLVTFAKQHDMAIRGHALVWHMQLPRWLHDRALGRRELREILIDHVRRVAGRYAGQIASWDVVNEAVALDGTPRQSLWWNAMGRDYMRIALETARESDPSALLFYNDFGIEASAAHAAAVDELVAELYGKALIDGVGFQMHLQLHDDQKVERFAQRAQRLCSAGLRVEVTELDIRVPLESRRDSHLLERQARLYASVTRACLDLPLCHTLTMWGVNDRYSWVPHFFPGEGAALLWDDTYSTKPCYDAVASELLREAPGPVAHSPHGDVHPQGGVRCTRPWTGFEVEHDGSVKACCMSHVTCGNANKQSIEEIWNGPVFRDFRRKMIRGDLDSVCRSDCPRLHGELDETPPQPKDSRFEANYRLNVEEIANGAVELKSRPRFWKVTHSTLCNLDCIMCYQDRKDLRNLPESFYAQLANHYQSVQNIQIIGGEPFVIRQLRGLLGDFPRDRFPDASFAIVTNGTVYDEGSMDLVRAVNMSWMSVSLDAATAETYERIRKRGTFTKTLAGLQAWVALGCECSFQVLASFTVMKENIHEIPDFVALVIELGTDCLFGRVRDKLGTLSELDEELLAERIGAARRLIRESTASMPLALLTLESIYPNASNAETAECGAR
jgi:endo-1,4-beta-xylanase